MPSKAFAKSKKTASTSSSPASTLIMSALGLVYLFPRRLPKKTVKVWTSKLQIQREKRRLSTYIECILVKRRFASFDLLDCSKKQLLRFMLYRLSIVFLTVRSRVKNTWNWSKSSALILSNRRWKPTLSGLSKKNSSQKPSESVIPPSLSYDSFSASFAWTGHSWNPRGIYHRTAGQFWAWTFRVALDV